MQKSRVRGRPGDKLEPAPEPKTAFQFPKMPYSEIQEDMAANNCDFPISKEAFRSPAQEDVKKVLDFFIHELYAKRQEDFAQATFGCLDAVEYPELYEDAIPQFNFLRQCQTMFEDAQFNEFGLRDLHAPEKNRFQWQLSALINIHKFRQTRVNMIEDVVGNFEELEEKERTNMEERSQLEREISIIEQAREKDEPELQSVKQEVSELGIKLSSIHKQQIELTDRTREDKQSLAKNMEHSAALTVKRMSEQQEVDRLRMKVVASPDRVKSEIQKMSETLASEKENIHSMEQRTKALRLRKAAVDKCRKDVEQAISAMDVLLVEQESALALQREIDEKSGALNEAEREIASIESSKVHLERVVSSIQQKLSRIGDQNTDFNRQTNAEDRILAEKEKEFAQEDAELSRQVDEKLAMINDVKQAIATEAAAFRQDVELFTRKHAELHEQFATFHTGIEDSQQMISMNSTQSFEALKDTIRHC